MTRTSAIEYLGELTVAPITSTIRDIPSEALLTKDDGMRKECAINLDHVQTVSKGKIGAKITELAPGKMSEVTSAIRFALDL